MLQRFQLTGKNAVVTGASGTIGGLMADTLARTGANVALCYHSNKDAIDQRIAALSSCGVTLRGYRIDCRRREAIAAHADQLMEDFGRIDIVVNAAGGLLPGSVSDNGLTLFDLDPDIMEQMVSYNLFGGCIWPCLFYSQKMVPNPEGGSIINITSMNAYRPLEGRASYAAAKAGVANFTQWLAVHLAKDLNPKIRVNAIAPGFFPSRQNWESMASPDGKPGWRGRKIIAHTPMGRLGEPDDLAGTLIWYASDASKYVTGTMTPVDGGFTAYAGL